MYDIIIIGAGTAGLTAAIYGLRAGKSVLVLEQASYGGQIINTPAIENYPGIERVSGYEFASRLYQQAEKLGMEYRSEKVTGLKLAELSPKETSAGEIPTGETPAGETPAGETPVGKGEAVSDSDIGKTGKVVETSSGSYMARTVILATGAKNRPLGVEREEEFVGKGVSYCATCDGMFFRGKEVAVAGGGNTALEDAAFLSNYCARVYLIHRRDAFRGEEKLVSELAQKENVEFLLNKTVTGLHGDTVLQAVTIHDKVSGKEEKLAVSGLFVAIGRVPENQAFAGLIDLDENGYILSGEECHTNIEGIFAAGDCRRKTVRQLTTAAADGAVAALAAASRT